MKKILFTGALVLGLALTLPAQQSDMNSWVESYRDTKLADLTVGDLKALADEQSVQMQKKHYVLSAGFASYLLPGVGQFKTGDPVGGSLHLLAQLAIVGGTAYGAYTLAPPEILVSGLTKQARHDLIETLWSTNPEKMAPAAAVMAGGMTLALINQIWASRDARAQAVDNIKEGKVTFEPYDMGTGFGMKMRY